MNLKNFITITLMLVTLSFVSFGQVKDDDQMFGNKRNVLSPNEKDLGKIALDAKATCKFLIKAKKDFEISIVEVIAPKGVNAVVNSKIIAPETNGEITVTIDATAIGAGEFSKEIIVKTTHTNKTSGAKVSKDIKYTVKGIIDGK
jgi:hypothetical protein